MYRNRLLALVFCLGLMFQSCGFIEENRANTIQVTQKRNNSNPHENIDKHRRIYVEGDSLILHPFEIYREMKFDGVLCGLLFYLDFSGNTPNSKVTFNDTFTSFSYDGDFDERLSWTGTNAEITLVSLNDTLRRRIVKNHTYKVIYSYEQDDAVLRSNVPTDNVSGYYVIDIVPVGQKFERQKKYQN